MIKSPGHLGGRIRRDAAWMQTNLLCCVVHSARLKGPKKHCELVRLRDSLTESLFRLHDGRTDDGGRFSHSVTVAIVAWLCYPY